MGGQALEVGVVHDDPRAVCCCFENVVPSTLVSVLLILGTCSAFPYSSMNRELPPVLMLDHLSDPPLYINDASFSVGIKGLNVGELWKLR